MRFPWPAFAIRISGPCPCFSTISLKRRCRSSSEPMSTWWMDIGMFELVDAEDQREARRSWTARLFLEYVRARWTPFW